MASAAEQFAASLNFGAFAKATSTPNAVPETGSASPLHLERHWGYRPEPTSS